MTESDADRTMTLDLPGMLHHLAACRAANDQTGFWFTVGASVLALKRAGYRHVQDPTPIAPDDRWRQALAAELEAAAAQWDDAGAADRHAAVAAALRAAGLRRGHGRAPLPRLSCPLARRWMPPCSASYAGIMRRAGGPRT